MRKGTRSFATVLLAAGIAGGALAFAAADGSSPPPRTARPEPVTRQAPAPTRPPFRDLDLRHPSLVGDHYAGSLEGGKTAELTFDTDLQQFVDRVFDQYAVPFGSVVALDPSSGRVLAYVNHSSANPNAGDLARDVTPPAASVFKIITGSALVEAGVTPGERVCYSGGMSRLSMAHLGEGGSTCATLGDAMGGSINAIFAKLADHHLDGSRLERAAASFGFGAEIPFDVPTEASPIEIPSERLEFARTSAGFWHSHMSPLHGALIASAIANDGKMPRPYAVERVVDAQGAELYHSEPSMWRQATSAATADAVGRMMQLTVTQGTSRKTFHDPRGLPFLPGIAVAGKTGTLSAENPYRGYTWWVGFAPANNPRIALAALVVNTPNWRIKANFVARETLRRYLVTGPHRLQGGSR
jgi:peptidoglycan glycosyltransferase